MKVIDPTRASNRRNLRAKITSLITTILIIAFAGILQQTYRSGSVPRSAGSDSLSSVPAETLSIANIYSGTITRNSSLYTELSSWQLPISVVSDLTVRFSRLFDLRGSKPGDKFKVFVSKGDTIEAFEYITSDWKHYRLDRNGNDYIATVNQIGLDRKVERVEGVIQTSLWDALLPLLPEWRRACRRR